MDVSIRHDECGCVFSTLRNSEGDVVEYLVDLCGEHDGIDE